MRGTRVRLGIIGAGRIHNRARTTLGDRASCVHAKDTVPWARTLTGDGVVDYDLVFALRQSLPRAVPLIIQDATPAQLPAIIAAVAPPSARCDRCRLSAQVAFHAARQGRDPYDAGGAQGAVSNHARCEGIYAAVCNAERSKQSIVDIGRATTNSRAEMAVYCQTTIAPPIGPKNSATTPLQIGRHTLKSLLAC